MLQLDELPIPDPAIGEVRLRVKAIGLNRAEVHVPKRADIWSSQSWASEARLRSLPERWKPWAQASTRAGSARQSAQCPVFRPTRMASTAKSPLFPLMRLPSTPTGSLTRRETSIWMQYITAYGALMQQGHAAKGDFVLITAASSSVGIAAIEIARAEGAISIAVTRTSQKKAALLALGAHHVIVTEEEDLAARVQQITSGKGARIVVRPYRRQRTRVFLVAAAASGGIVFEYGALASEPTPFPLFAVIGKHLTYQRGTSLRSSRRSRGLSEGHSSTSSITLPPVTSSRASTRFSHPRKIVEAHFGTWSLTRRSARLLLLSSAWLSTAKAA